jgi:hypothetical protein
MADKPARWLIHRAPLFPPNRFCRRGSQMVIMLADMPVVPFDHLN